MKRFIGRAYDRKDVADVKTILYQQTVWARSKEEAGQQFLQLLLAAFDVGKVSGMYYTITGTI